MEWRSLGVIVGGLGGIGEMRFLCCVGGWGGMVVESVFVWLFLGGGRVVDGAVVVCRCLRLFLRAVMCESMSGFEDIRAPMSKVADKACMLVA